MPDVPEPAVELAAKAMRELHHLDPEQACTLATAALDAAAPVLAEAVARKITEHAERQHPRDPEHVPTAWHRHFSIAARVAAGAFDTREDQLRMAAEAIGRGDFVVCNPPAVAAECPSSKMDDGSHAADYEDSGLCPWCGEANPEVRR